MVDMNDAPEAGGPRISENARKWAGYDPDIVDFIRRCETVEQALEVIEYLENRGEVTEERAVEVRKQVMERGLRSFGSKKDKGFYHMDR